MLASSTCSGLYVVDSDFRFVILVMRHGQIIAVQLWNENASLGAEATRDSANQLVFVGVFLSEDINELVSGNVNALLFGIVSHVVNHANRRNFRDDFAIL